MRIIVFKPTTSSKRHQLSVFCKINKQPTIKLLLKKIVNAAGRNNLGKITIRHKGNLNKKLYRIVSFINQINVIGIVFSIEYDPFRTSNIASVYDIQKKSFFYIIAPSKLNIGNIIKTNNNKIGNYSLLNRVSLGCPVYNVSSSSNGISKFSRSAGTYCIIITKNQSNCEVLLSSGSKLLLSIKSFCNIGVVSNELYFLRQLGKAGRSRWLNIRPSVRGVSMNPIDHPNGGGEGKKSSNKRSPWGKLKK